MRSSAWYAVFYCSDLLANGVITKANKGRKLYKVLGGADLSVEGLVVRAHAFSTSARVAIEGCKGVACVLSETRHIPIEEANAMKAELKQQRLDKLRALRKLKLATKQTA